MVDGEVNRSSVYSNTNSDHEDDDDNDSEGAVADACYLDDQDFDFDNTTEAAAAHPSSLPQFVPLPNVLEESHRNNSNNNSNNNGLPLLLGGHARIATTELDGHIRTKRPRLDDLAVDTAIGTSVAATAASIHPPNDEAISTEAEAATESATEAEASENNNNNNMSSSYTASSSSSVGAVDGGNSSLTVTSSSSHPSSSTRSSSSHSSNSSIAGSHRDGLARWQWRSRPSHCNKNRKNNKSTNPKSSLLQQPSSGSFSSALTTATEDDDLIGIVEEEEATIEGGRSSFTGNPQPEQPLHDYDATSTCRDSQPLLEQEQEKPQTMAFQPEEEHATTAGEAATSTKPICSDSGAVMGTGTTVTTMLELQITPQNSMAQFPCHYDHPPTPKASNVAPFRNNHSTFSFGDTRQQDAPPSSTITATTMAPLANTTTMIHLSDNKHHRKQNSNHRRRHHHHHGNNHHNNSHSDAAAVEQLTSRLNNWCSINFKTKRRNNIYAEADQQHNGNQDTIESNQEQQQQQLPPPPLMASYPTAYRSNLYNPTQDYDYSNHWLARHIRKLQCQSANKEVMRALRNGNKKPPGVTATGGSTSSHSMGVTSSRNAVMDGSSTTALTPPSFLWIMKDPSNTNNINDSTVGSTTGAAVDPPIFAAETTNITSINNGSSTDVIMGE